MIEKGRLIMFEDLFYDRLIKLRTEKKVSAREMSLALGHHQSFLMMVITIP